MSHAHRPVHRHLDDITFAAIERLASDEAACLAFFEAMRFPRGLICPTCRAEQKQGCDFTRHRSRRGLHTCGGCRRQFLITSGTAMHGSKLALGQWLRAIWLVVASSKGISARKLGEMLGLTYKVAWHLSHRIRSMMSERQISLSGVVEIDEIYAGAPPRKPHGGGPSGVRSGRGPRRPLVLTTVERGGQVVLQRIASHSSLWPPRTRDRVISERSVYVSNRYFGDALGKFFPSPAAAPMARRLKSVDDTSGPEIVAAMPTRHLVADVPAG